MLLRVFYEKNPVSVKFYMIKILLQPFDNVLDFVWFNPDLDDNDDIINNALIKQ